MLFFGTKMIVEVFRQDGTMMPSGVSWGLPPSACVLPRVRLRLLRAGGCGGCEVATPRWPHLEPCVEVFQLFR